MEIPCLEDKDRSKRLKILQKKLSELSYPRQSRGFTCFIITSDPCLPDLIADSLVSSDDCGVQCIEQHGPLMARIENGPWRDPSGGLIREATPKINAKFFKREF